MRNRSTVVLSGIGLLTALTFGLWRVKPPRRPSREAVDDLAVARAFAHMSSWPQFRALQAVMLQSIAQLQPQGRLVDIGCGNGALLVALAHRFPTLQLEGVDSAAAMLEQAQHTTAAALLDHAIPFQLGDVVALPYANDTIDLAITTLSLHHWTQPATAFAEIYRVLKPHAHLLVFDVRRDIPRIMYGLLQIVQRYVVPAAMRQNNEPLGSFRASYTADEITALMAATPFPQFRVQSGLAWNVLIATK